MYEKIEDARILSGNSHPRLALNISRLTGIPIINCVCNHFANKEINVSIKDNIRNKDIILIQTGCSIENMSINDLFMETLILIDACKRSSTKSITLIMPHYPYSRQDKKNESRAPISAKLVANMLTTAGIDRLIVMDLHASQIQGFFDIPVDNLYFVNLLTDHLNKTIIQDKPDDYIVISPDEGAIKRNIILSQQLKLPLGIMHKQRNYSKLNTVEKSVLICEGELVKGKTAIICDDMCDTGGSLISAVNSVIEHGAKDVICIITHGIFSDPALERINKCPHIKKIIVSSSIDQQQNIQKTIVDKCVKIEEYNISPIISEIIKKIYNGGSVSALFDEMC